MSIPLPDGAMNTNQIQNWGIVIGILGIVLILVLMYKEREKKNRKRLKRYLNDKQNELRQPQPSRTLSSAT